MSIKINGYATMEAAENIRQLKYDAGELRSEQVEIKVSHCGISHSMENFKMTEINEAFEHLEKGKPRYRIVLENDF